MPHCHIAQSTDRKSHYLHPLGGFSQLYSWVMALSTSRIQKVLNVAVVIFGRTEGRSLGGSGTGQRVFGSSVGMNLGSSGHGVQISGKIDTEFFS